LLKPRHHAAQIIANNFSRMTRALFAQGI